MGSLSFSEIVVIALVILIVFGPNRLPDLARKAGELMNKARNASSSMSDALGVDYEETVEPLRSAKRDFDSIKDDLTKTVTTFGQAISIPEDTEAGNAPAGNSVDASEAAKVDAADPEPGDAADNSDEANPADVDSPDDSTAAT